VLTRAVAEGFNVLGVSGGEPLLYEPLPAVLAHAKALGMTTTVTTNGTVLNASRLSAIRPVTDLLAISLDGLSEAHNAMRGSIHAFSSLVKRLPLVRATGLPFGFIVTLTRRNASELDELARFAVDNGAALLQIHPLEEVGAARSHLTGEAPDERELAIAFLEAARIQRTYAGRLTVQYDAVDRDVVRADPARLYADAPVPDAVNRPLSELVSPIVLEPDGVLVPLQYGFDRRYALGDLSPAAVDAWRSDIYPAFRTLCRGAYEDVVSTGSPLTPFANWYGAISDRSRTTVVAA
jgi:MoaA/NifB/PqqE/SkfB family radical SAM enzyme